MCEESEVGHEERTLFNFEQRRERSVGHNVCFHMTSNSCKNVQKREIARAHKAPQIE